MARKPQPTTVESRDVSGRTYLAMLGLGLASGLLIMGGAIDQDQLNQDQMHQDQSVSVTHVQGEMSYRDRARLDPSQVEGGLGNPLPTVSYWGEWQADV